MNNIEKCFKIDLINMKDTITASKTKIPYIKAQGIEPKYLSLDIGDLIEPIKDDEFIVTKQSLIKNLEKENTKSTLDSEIENQNELLKKYVFGYYLTKDLKTLFKGKSLKERLKIITNTVGLSLNNNNIYTIMTELFKYSSVTQKNTHLVLTGDKEYGKSFPFDSILKEETDYSFFINKYAGIPTTADLRGSKTEKNKEFTFTLLDRDILVFDEISDITKDPDSIPLLKASLESKSYQKFESKVTPTNSSIIMIGNMYFDLKNFNELSTDKYISKIIGDEALLDRFSGVLIHNHNLFGERALAIGSNDDGIPAIHFASILYYLRHTDYTNSYLIDCLKEKKGRENLAISNLASGLLKVLYPENTPSKCVVEGIVEFATHFRSLTQKNIYNPFKSKTTKFLIEILKDEDIEYSTLLNNRLFLKIKNKNICKKIALTNFGVDDNKLEYEVNKKYPGAINKIIDSDKNFISIYQEINAPLATDRKSYEDNTVKKAEPKEFNYLLLDSIEYAAFTSRSCPENKFIGVPDFIHNQVSSYISSKLSQNIMDEFKLKIPPTSEIKKSSYAYGQDTIEIINISRYKITK